MLYRRRLIPGPEFKGSLDNSGFRTNEFQRSYDSREELVDSEASPPYPLQTASKPPRNSASQSRKVTTTLGRGDSASGRMPQHSPVEGAPPPLFKNCQVNHRCPNPSNFKQPQRLETDYGLSYIPITSNRLPNHQLQSIC